MSQPRRGYIDTDTGQLHYYEWSPAEAEHANNQLWIGLAPLPYGGIFYKALAAARPANVHLLAPDLPGYGQSEALAETPTIEAYGNAIEALIRAVNLPAMQVFGFHAGALVAIELGTRSVAQLGALHLIDVPAFDADTRNSLKAKTAPTRPFGEALESIAALWQFNIGRHGAAQSIERGVELLLEDLKAGVDQPLGFRAVFSYDALAAATKLKLPVRLAGTTGALVAPTQALAEHIPQADYDTLDQLQAPVFEGGANAMARWLFSNPR